MKQRLPVYAGKWPTVRKRVLERDGYVCQIQGKTCTHRATCVDHIIPVLQGGAWWDVSNLRAACLNCNNSRIGANKSQRWQTAITHITLVVGDDPAALSAHIHKRAQPTDVVVDLASLTASIGNTSAATAALTTVVDRLRRGEVRAARAWISSTDPKAALTLPHHTLVDLRGRSSGGSDSRAGVVADQDGHQSSYAAASLEPSRAW